MQKSPNIVTRTIAETTVLVSLKFNNGLFAYHLDEVSAFLWAAIDKCKSTQEIIDQICAEFDVEKEQATLDVQSYLEDLKTAGLLL